MSALGGGIRPDVAVGEPVGRRRLAGTGALRSLTPRRP